jgi:hypothetical protein
VAVQPLVQSGKRREVGIGGVARRLVGAAPFQQRDHRENVVQVLLGHLVDEAAAPRLMPQQALRRQHLERLAQRRARDFQALAQRDLVQEAPGRQLAREDLLAQCVGDFLVQ